MKIVQIQIVKLVLRLLPVDLQETKVISFLTALLQPFLTVHFAFLAYLEDSNARAKLNGQTLILENLLNRRIVTAAGLIRVVNSSLRLDAVYLFNTVELQPEVWLSDESEADPVFLSSADEDRLLYDFLVQVPVATTTQERTRIRSLVDKYKLATKSYEVQNL